MRFQSTRPLRGGTYPESRADTHIKISIHPSLAGRDDDDRPRQMVRLISIRPPLAGRDPKRSVIVIVFVISIHPPLAGRDPTYSEFLAWTDISIHPPLAGRDQAADRAQRDCRISIHPPLAGRDLAAAHLMTFHYDFNPPAPCGAGPPTRPSPRCGSDFNPPAPCGAGPLDVALGLRHAEFQSTRPLRGGTATPGARISLV